MNRALILAFSFVSPWILAGLALAAIPIIIHLLYKRTFRETPWAAMRFLAEAARKQSRKTRLEQLLLLAARVLLICLVVLALARPRIESIGAPLPSEAPKHKLIAIDASFSMGAKPAPGDESATAFDTARDVARRIAAAARPGDAFNLVRISDVPPRVLIRRPTFQPRQVAEEIDRLPLSDATGDVATALSDIEALLEEAPTLERKEVFLISDFQRSTWSPAGDKAAEIAKHLQRLAAKAELSLIDVSEPPRDNSAVTEFRASQPFAAVGQPLRLSATISNFSDNPLPPRRLDLLVDGRLTQSATVEAPPRQEVRLEFVETFAEPGEHRLEIRLEDDLLPIDNHRRLALPVKQSLGVLLVNGNPAGRPAENAVFYLQTLLSPSTARDAAHRLLQPTVINDGELSTVALGSYDCICLCDVPLLTERETDLLRQYVQGGGGLVVFLGPRVRAENYNLTLFQDGAGVLPARIGNRVGNAAQPQDAFELDTARLDHPILEPFVGNPGTGLESSLTFEYFQLQPAADSRIVLKFTSGDPAIVEASKGRGRVVLVATTADVRWGTWPAHRSFPPLIHQILHDVIQGRWTDRQQLVGQPLQIAVPLGTDGESLQLTLPDGRRETLPTQAQAVATYPRTDHSGFYEVAAPAAALLNQLFAVNVDPAESNLETLAEQDLRPLGSNLHLAHYSAWKPASRPSQAPVAETSGLSRVLLAAALVLLIVELLMAWNFRLALVLLVPLLGAAVAFWGFAWHPAAGWIALVAAAAIAAILFLRRGPLPQTRWSHRRREPIPDFYGQIFRRRGR